MAAVNLMAAATVLYMRDNMSATAITSFLQTLGDRYFNGNLVVMREPKKVEWRLSYQSAGVALLSRQLWFLPRKTLHYREFPSATLFDQWFDLCLTHQLAAQYKGTVAYSYRPQERLQPSPDRYICPVDYLREYAAVHGLAVEDLTTQLPKEFLFAQETSF